MPSIPKILLKDYTAGQLDLDESSLDQNSSLYFMLQRVGRRKDVLDLGCSTGYFAKLMSAHDCNVTGIEVNPDVAEEAKKYCSRVFIADLDFTPLAEAVEGKTFDVIVLGDILEHLRNPADILDESRRLLRADGYVVASIPNVAHGAIRLALLKGNFDYRELGILDETHLRFFTLKTIEELFLEAGYEIRHIDRTKVDVFDNVSELSAVPAVSRDEFSEETIAQIERDPESNTLQFIVQAFPLSDEAKLRAITKQYNKVNTELSRAQSLIERQTDLLIAAKAENQEPMLQADTARLEALESELKQRVTEREALAADRDMWRAKVSAELPAAQTEVTRLAALASDLQARAQQHDAAQAALLAERDRLLSELQTRAAEREALAADRDTWRGKVSAELPVAQAEVARLAALASDLQTRAQQHDAAQAVLLAERDRLLSELQTRAAEREALAADRDTWREKVAVELPAAQAEVARLAALVSELRQLSIEREAAHTEAAAGFTREIDSLRSKLSAMEALQSELDSLKDELESVKVQRDSSSVMARQQSLVAQRLQQTLAQSSARIGTLEEELANLSSTMRETHEEMGKAQEALRARDSEVEGAVKHIASLENEIGHVQQVLKTRDSEVEHAVARIADLENEIGHVQQVLKTRDSELGQSKDRLAALENVNAGLEQKLASAHEAASEVQQRLNETQNRLFDQTNLFLASTQAENERLTLLIDTVQSSRFWKIKRILGRFRQALAG